MELFELLKRFKNIAPSADFTEKSKRAILAVVPREAWSIRRAIYHVLETGVAVALAGLFVFVVMGGLSGSKLSPVDYSAIDPQSLHAEAQAINVQIKLSSVVYNEASTNPTAAVAALKSPDAAAAGTSASSTAGGAATSSSASSTTLSVDQALQALTK